MSSTHEKGKRSTVPKFASFKPNPPDAAQNVAETGADRSRPEEHHTAQTRNRQGRRHTSVEVNVASKPTVRLARDSQRQLAERDAGGDPWYCLDKRGDNLIIRYGSNDRGRIPGYRRIGAGHILGADGVMKIDKLGNREEFSIRNHYESSSLLSNDKKNLLARGIRPDARSIRIRRTNSETGATAEDYLSLRTSRKRKRDGSISEESSGEEGPSYRSIHGKSKNSHSDSDESYDSYEREDASNEDMSGPMTMRSVELSRKVHQHSEDLESWLELVDHQNSLLDFQTGGRAPTAAELKSFADIKLSLLEKALSYTEDDWCRETLDLKIIEEGLKVWEFKVALKRLADIMQQYPKSFEAWKLYVNFMQATLPICRFDEIKRLYADKIRSLGEELLSLSAISEQLECSKQIIYVFLRLTRFLADAGFAELALAAWQASLELSVARPSASPQKGLEIPSSFQEYWESEVPRLGEDDWRGWATFVADAAAQEPPDPKTFKQAIPPNTRDGYKAWYTTEHYRAQNATIPARTLDEGAEDDPFRVVMFVDFQDILLYFPMDVVPHLKQQLLDAFLIFCHLPPTRQDGDLVKEVAKDSFLPRSAHDVPFTRLLSRNKPDLSEDQLNKSPDFFHEIQYMSPTPEVLFPSPRWFKYLGPVRDSLPHARYQWIATALKQLLRVVGTGGLGPYALAFESINEPGNEKKSAKALLKQDSLNVDLYLGYSILEHERKNKSTALGVVSAALGLPSLSAHDRVRLCIQAAWLELDDGELTKAVLQLCRFAEDGPKADNAQLPEPVEASPSQILKAKQFLFTNRDYKISSGDISQAVIYAEGLVLLEYLTQRNGKEPTSQRQGDIQSAILRITQCSEDLVSRCQQQNPAHERFLQSSARLLYYHATHGAFRSGLLREQLTQYLSYFPSNTIFLSLFAWREERLSVNDRVRSLLQDSILTRTNESLPSHVFAISYELRTGNAHSARAAFERALASDVCRHHVGLWIAYVRFCHSRRELRGKAKAVFYRAVQACPWSKAVYMEAFATLVREMDSAELKSVYTTMCEKGLRIHVDMDEFVENWRKEMKGVEKERERDGKSRKKEGRSR
ncbi:DUF1740-domain-containing protein [Xylaria sp. FL0064]|nr:DUF1740-domain-containing protein [Xylaria sp. FL0064]